MKLKFLLTSLLVLFAASVILPQQEDTTKSEDKWKEWEEWEDDHHEDWNWDWDDWDVRFNMFSGKSRPTISVLYGLSDIRLKDFGSKFADPALVEVKLGYTRRDSLYNTPSILWHRYNYFYVGNTTTDLKKSDAKIGDIQTNLWRFGFGWEKGYGYRLGPSEIIPYHSGGMEWSRLKFATGPVLRAHLYTTDDKYLDYLADGFRFGTHAEAGIKFNPIENISIEGGYERAAIFPRHIFWKWAGSALIEVAAQGLLDEFIDEIRDSSPYAAPIVNALLKGALSYGIYELREEKMNWPFNSDAPLMYDQIKFGITFMF